MKKPTHIHLTSRDLKPALAGLAKVIPRKRSLPVLGCVKIQVAERGMATLTATDLDTYLEWSIPCETDQLVPAFLVPLHDWQQGIKTCAANDRITLELAGDRLTCFRVMGRTPVPQILNTQPVAEFPEIPRIKVSPVSFDRRACDALREALACASTDHTRAILRGALLESGSTFVGTDGRHLYRCNGFKLPVSESAILPASKALDWVLQLGDGELSLALDKEWFRLMGDHWRITGRLIDGHYPSWKQVVPADGAFCSSAVLAPDLLDAAAATLTSLPGANIQNKPVGLHFEGGNLTLMARSGGGEDESLTRVPLEGARCEGPSRTVFINRDFLIKALRFGLNRIDVTDALSPIRLSRERDGRRFVIVMPVRAGLPSENSSGHQLTPVRHHQPPTPTMKTPTIAQPHPAPVNGHHRMAEATAPSSDPIDQALALASQLKEQMRQTANGLADIALLIKQAKANQKSTEREVRQVRSTIRTLQKVAI